MIVEIPGTGERVEANVISDDSSVPLGISIGHAGQATYGLAAVIQMGWRVVECTPDEQALMRSHGILLPNEPHQART